MNLEYIKESKYFRITDENNNSYILSIDKFKKEYYSQREGNKSNIYPFFIEYPNFDDFYFEHLEKLT